MKLTALQLEIMTMARRNYVCRSFSPTDVRRHLCRYSAHHIAGALVSLKSGGFLIETHGGYYNPKHGMPKHTNDGDHGFGPVKCGNYSSHSGDIFFRIAHS